MIHEETTISLTFNLSHPYILFDSISQRPTFQKWSKRMSLRCKAFEDMGRTRSKKWATALMHTSNKLYNLLHFDYLENNALHTRAPKSDHLLTDGLKQPDRYHKQARHLSREWAFALYKSLTRLLQSRKRDLCCRRLPKVTSIIFPMPLGPLALTVISLDSS